MTVKLTGVRDFQTQMRKLGSSFNEAVENGVWVTAQEVRTYAIKSIQEASPGKPVKRQRQSGKGTRPHIAAAVGQAPNSDTGKLVASIPTDKIESGYRVGSNLPYATYLEFGTKKMGARPWLQPAVQANRKKLIENIQKVVDIYIDRLPK